MRTQKFKINILDVRDNDTFVFTIPGFSGSEMYEDDLDSLPMNVMEAALGNWAREVYVELTADSMPGDPVISSYSMEN